MRRGSSLPVITRISHADWKSLCCTPGADWRTIKAARARSGSACCVCRQARCLGVTHRARPLEGAAGSPRGGGGRGSGRLTHRDQRSGNVTADRELLLHLPSSTPPPPQRHMLQGRSQTPAWSSERRCGLTPPSLAHAAVAPPRG